MMMLLCSVGLGWVGLDWRVECVLYCGVGVQEKRDWRECLFLFVCLI